MARTGGTPTPPVRHRRGKRRDGLATRLARLDALDVIMLGCYTGMVAWGVVAQFEPPITLVGARIVTVAILVFAASAVAALIFDQCEAEGTRGDVELPVLVGFIGAWGTYSTTAWLLVAGLGDPHAAPVLKVFGVLTSIMLVPFLVRLGTLVHGAVSTIRAARRARELGLVDEKWNTIK